MVIGLAIFGPPKLAETLSKSLATFVVAALNGVTTVGTFVTVLGGVKMGKAGKAWPGSVYTGLLGVPKYRSCDPGALDLS